ncbi:uncharacterized protein LOC125031147 [Penaeus chinensis]|uniref:uncharacterized protein LOC125031147 n=1 Tax=Penaeus chinensis TaxID=139456 RepID=UPI001FB6F770|nr:uncharacterized protein LOC125031147 [Penaeus chinensis]XP_047477646.1 uncharacterized protein LOC125031147 [Penaeus chinensis]XP_047477647.1 uncharacterized protein LOC125031147 [Penaeus chinensis]
MESDSDEEIFFGPVTVKEQELSSKLKNRRTELFSSGPPLFRRRSSRPSLASLEEEGKGCDNDSTTSLIVHGYSACGTLSSSAGEESSHWEGSVANSSSQSSGLAESTEVLASSSDSLQSNDKPLFVFQSQSKAKLENKSYETENEIFHSNSGNPETDSLHHNSAQEVSLVSRVGASCESSDSALHSDSYCRTSEGGSSRNIEELEPSEMEISESEVDTPEADLPMSPKAQGEAKTLSRSVVEAENSKTEYRDRDPCNSTVSQEVTCSDESSLGGDAHVIEEQDNVCNMDQEVQSEWYQENSESSQVNSIRSTERADHKRVDSSNKGSSMNIEELEPSEMEISESEVDTPEPDLHMSPKTQEEARTPSRSVVDAENTKTDNRDAEPCDSVVSQEVICSEESSMVGDAYVIGEQDNVCNVDQEMQSECYKENSDSKQMNSIGSTVNKRADPKIESCMSQPCNEIDKETSAYKGEESPETEKKITSYDSLKDSNAVTQEKSSLEGEKISDLDPDTSLLKSYTSRFSSKSQIESHVHELTRTKKLVKPRESYYSSLEVINVNEANIFDEFITEEKNYQPDLEQICATDKKVFPHIKDQQSRLSLKKYSSSTCEFLSEGSDSVFTNFPSSGSDMCLISGSEMGRNLPDTPSSRNSEGDDSVFLHKNDMDNVCTTDQPKTEREDSCEADDSVSPVTPPPKGPLMKVEEDPKFIFTVTPPPTSLLSLRKILPHPLVSATSSYSSSSQNLGESGIDSYGPANRAIIFSQSDSEPASFSSQPIPSTASNADVQNLSNCTSESGDIQDNYSSVCHSHSGSAFSYMSKDDLDSSDNGSDGESSPDQKFNDTIEEMEMMLKYGLNYGEKKENDEAKGKIPSSGDICSAARKAHAEFSEVDDNDESESIVSPRKSSVASTISNFQPNMDSTRSSSLREDVEKPMIFVQSPETVEINEVRSPSVLSNKKQKEAPPKPPRNFNLQNVNLQKHPEEARAKMQKRSPVSKPVSISRLKPSPLSLTPKVSKVDTTKKVVKQSGPRVVNEPGLYKSGSLTNIYRTSKVGESPVRIPVQSVAGFRSQPNSPLTKTFTSQKKNSPSEPGPRVVNEPDLYKSGSLTNIYRTSKVGESPVRIPVQSVAGFRSQPNSPLTKTFTSQKKNSPSEPSMRLNSGRTALPPRPPVVRANIKPISSLPSHQINKFSTPQGKSTRTKMHVSSASKIHSPSLKTPKHLRFKHGMSIVSPVAKYLKENPPPPLVVNIKPKHKISPVKIQSESPVSFHSPLASSQNSPQRLAKRIHREDAEVQRKAALSKIQGDLDKLASKMNNAQIESGEDETLEPVDVTRKQVLPRAVYTSAPVVVDSLENKENERIRRCRDIPTDKHPVLVMKHKGRVKLPKVTFKEGLVDGSSPKGYKSPTLQNPVMSSLKDRQSLRNSLMEVSIYESHETQYTHTLQK